MKNIIAFLCLSLFLSGSLFSQQKRESREKIKALKIAFLTEQLNLSPKEAQQFWPIYNTYDNKQNSLRYKSRQEMKKVIEAKGSIENISEQEAQKMIELKLETDKKIYELQSEFVSKVKKVLSHKKIIQLQIAEMEFGRNLMKKYRRKKEK